MVIINPHIKKQLQDLKKIPYNSIKSASAVIVDMPIGQMKSHDLGRALYVVTNAFTELTHKQQVIVKVIKQSQEDIKKAIDNKDFTKEEMLSDDFAKKINETYKALRPFFDWMSYALTHDGNGERI